MLSSSAFTGPAGRAGLFQDPFPRSPVNRKRLDTHIHVYHQLNHGNKRVRFRADVKVRLRPSASNLRPLCRLAARRDTGEIPDSSVAALDAWDLAWREYLGEYYDDHMVLAVPHGDPVRFRNYVAAREQLCYLARQLTQSQWAAGIKAADQAELDGLPPSDGTSCINFHAQMIQLLLSRATVLARLVESAQCWQEVEASRWGGGHDGDSTTSGLYSLNGVLVLHTPQVKDREEWPNLTLSSVPVQSPDSLCGAETDTGRSTGYEFRPKMKNATRTTVAGPISNHHETFCEYVDQVDAYQKKYKRLCDSVRRVQRKARRHRQLQQSGAPISIPSTSAVPGAFTTTGSSFSILGNRHGIVNGTCSTAKRCDTPGIRPSDQHKQTCSSIESGSHDRWTGDPIAVRTEDNSLMYPPTLGVSSRRPSFCSVPGKMRVITATVAKKVSEGDLGRFAFPPIRRRAGSATSVSSTSSWVTTSSGSDTEPEEQPEKGAHSASPSRASQVDQRAQTTSCPFRENTSGATQPLTAGTSLGGDPDLSGFAGIDSEVVSHAKRAARQSCAADQHPISFYTINRPPASPRSETFSHATACYHFLN